MVESAEWFELVDAEDRACGRALRCDCHGDPALIHRTVHVVVVGSDGRILLQKRPSHKDIQPGRWDTAVGGHVAGGESYEEAARREAAEELGIGADGLPVEYLFDLRIRNAVESENVRVFRTVHEGPFQPPPGEVDALTFWSRAEIEARLGTGCFTPVLEQEFGLLRRAGLLDPAWSAAGGAGPTVLRSPDAGLAWIVAEAGRRWPDRPFITRRVDDTLVDTSYGDFCNQVRAWGQFLLDRGVKAGDRVAFVTPKSIHQVRLFYACWWSGAIAVPVCESLGDLEMGFILRDSEPVLIIADASVAPTVGANSGDLEVVEFGDLPASAAAESGDESPVPVNADEVATLIYTSGSTGMPKGVMLTHRNLRLNAQSARKMIRIGPSDVVVSLLPYWHTFALVVEVVIAPLIGCRVTIPVDKRDFKRNIKRYCPTIILLVPRIAAALRSGIEKQIATSSARVRGLFDRALHNASRIFTPDPGLSGGLLRLIAHHAFYDPLVFRRIRAAFGGRLRFFVSGGAPLDVEHQVFFKRIGAPVYQGYGLSESSPVISVNYDDVHRLGSSGKVLPWLRPENGGDYTFRDDSGALGRCLHGELLVRGSCVMKGYWRHRDASAKTLTDGWLHTGDIGYVDADGFLFIDGRKGNMIVLVGGEKLHPEHVEDAIKLAPMIAEAMVIGEGCKKVYVCVNIEPECRPEGETGELQRRARAAVQQRTAHLAPFQRPKDVLLLPAFNVEDGTLTVTLKIRRHRVWELYGREIRAFLAAGGEESASRDAR